MKIHYKQTIYFGGMWDIEKQPGVRDRSSKVMCQGIISSSGLYM